ncbi:WD40/YVTN/BNR-like repeat-containing protein [Catalinimonas niigatensis]|uniref:WD40/YVTN/BNR-like repeat-containing protein n=1 Tax=Catalinimonas niigatensis TaxID=1397264 RepID=UPI002665A969|nr:glycosyl hydrolase [Catalinimonas niigatensis]WPP50659.1 glycosyl hydrolase [Catalinimonas niigatensis]
MLFLLFITCENLQAQKRNRNQATTISYDTVLYSGLKWRSIGPYRGGRSATVTGVPGKPNLFYFGATGGGVWKTEDAGQTWSNISDGYFGGSIGAVAVSEYDNNVIYVGGGEKTVRGNVSFGYGMWKSTDAGKTWENIGLNETRQIGRIRIHPRNPDIVYVAAIGNLFAPHEQRGVFRSMDGGKNWEKVLYANDQAGAVDLVFDPSNPRILYASTWRIKRTPYSLESGGEGSALWKSTDGGDNWKEISKNKGMPHGTLGIIGVTVSPVNSERVFAIIEAENGGVFRSDNGGQTWTKTNEDRSLRQRAWYYTRIYADTKDEDIVYVLNVDYHKSKDGGKSFEAYEAPHGDHHDLWIAPEDNQRMVIADDGGAQVSMDGGDNWTTYHNQPTAQFYRVVTDDHFPYRIYGAQQDNSTLRILHRTDDYSINENHWEETAGGESAHLAVDPENNDIVYGGSYGGFLSRVNHDNNQIRLINVWPDNPMGYGAKSLKYRFQWNYPIFFSPHNPNKLYVASNHLHATTNEGQSWEEISPDLTRNDTTKLGSSGGPITKDNTSVEYYATIFAAIESPYEEGLLWTGSDDGLMHISRDGGKNWENVTPPAMPEWMMINSIEADPFTEGGAYVAGTRYKLGDFQPYLYKTKDYGKSWQLIVSGIDSEHFTRVVRADPKRQGLLYAGTETAMYFSFDDGASWSSFQLNLPTVPITDLAVKENNLIAATQGRSFWLIDDLTPLHQLNEKVAGSNFYLYQPTDSYLMDGGQRGDSPTEGANHPGGVMIHFFLRDSIDSTTTISLKIKDNGGQVIKEYSTAFDKEEKDLSKEKLEVKQGFNTFNWDMRYPNAKSFEGMILWGGGLNGPKALPGTYQVELAVNDNRMGQNFKIIADPRWESTQADLQAQHDFLMSVRDKLTETHQAIEDIRNIREQMNTVVDKVKGNEAMQEIVDKAKAIDQKMTVIEQELYQTKNRSGQDPLNFPIKLNNKLANVGSQVGYGHFKPTQQAIDFKDEIIEKIDEQLQEFKKVINQEVSEFNRMVQEKNVSSVSLKDTPQPVNP